MDKNSMCRLCINVSDEFICIFDEETLEIVPEVDVLFKLFQLEVIRFKILSLKYKIYSNFHSPDPFKPIEIQYNVSEVPLAVEGFPKIP